MTTPAVSALVANSISLIRREQHPSGSYPACPSYPTYRYCWFRDGSFIADAMSRAGEVASAEAFFGWCTRVLTTRSDRIAALAGAGPGSPRVYLPTRYELDGGESVTPWANFQVDGYGTWLRVLVDHCARHRRPVAPYSAALNLTVDYLNAVGTLPCYDWWEEFPEQRHTSTLAAVSSGLKAALSSEALTSDRRGAAVATSGEIDRLVAADTRRHGRLGKWLGSDVADGSLLACLTSYGTLAVDDPVAERTVAAIRDSLVREGVYRYAGDTFYGGGEWINLTAWLGWYEVLRGDSSNARRRLDWIASQADGGLLPEQVTGRAQRPEHIAHWERTWGAVATPLLWSHAMFLTLATACR
ncbi:glycoside hydrolase family 15 protein [Symbioplanes lichenis]|uniref:glycoside hydrolase family 15 protein n=1 Tax=Symbioplanes lichenis TaxID=1629072 RepID=UPI00273966E5|nr:glycoside hydrolase family 15 protein [Actinoplanes lichenis]